MVTRTHLIRGFICKHLNQSNRREVNSFFLYEYIIFIKLLHSFIDDWQLFRIGRSSRGLTEDEVIENAYLVMVAGYETTANSLATLTHHISRNREVQERIREELRSIDEKTGNLFEQVLVHSSSYNYLYKRKMNLRSFINILFSIGY